MFLEFCIAKTYLDEKMSSLAKKAVRAEDLDDGTFVSFMMIQDKLSPEEIYGSVSEILAASVDTVGSIKLHNVSYTKRVQVLKDFLGYYDLTCCFPSSFVWPKLQNRQKLPIGNFWNYQLATFKATYL